MELPRFDKAHITTIGDVMLDRYWHGASDRVSAEAPIPVIDVIEVEDRLGGAANVALNVTALGAGSCLIGALGNDNFAPVVRNKLQSAAIEDGLVCLEDYQTITKFRIVSRKQQIARADFERVAELAAINFKEQFVAALVKTDVVILSDYDKGVLSEPEHFIELARAAGKPLLVDPKFKDFSRYSGATLIKPNQKEFQAAVGSWQNEAELIQKSQQMMSNLGLEALLVTRGGDGMTLVQKNQQEIHLPARNNDVYDVSGAGDTVIATLASALAAGATMADAVGLANIAAGIVVGRLGTASISGPELRIEAAKDEPLSKGFYQGVMSEAQLLIAVADARTRGEKITFTNGCFDILHAGHVEYLAEARAEGDRLIVAVNSDESVNRLKGEGRPINNIERRMLMLSGLSAVDWVVEFKSDTPEALLKRLLPDILVKGGDYGVDEVVGADIVLEAGGEVKVLKLVDGVSTTSLAQKIKSL